MFSTDILAELYKRQKCLPFKYSLLTSCVHGSMKSNFGHMFEL